MYVVYTVTCEALIGGLGGRGHDWSVIQTQSDSRHVTRDQQRLCHTFLLVGEKHVNAWCWTLNFVKNVV